MDQHNAPLTRLSTKALAAVPDSVTVPGCDRSRVTARIAHVAVGGFHRARQAMYPDRLMTAGTSHDRGICGVGLLPGDRAMQRVLQAQGCLYTPVVKHPDGTLEPRVTGSLAGYLFAPDDPEAVTAGHPDRLADHHRGRLRAARGDGGVRPAGSRGRRRPASRRAAGHRVRAAHARTSSPSCASRTCPANLGQPRCTAAYLAALRSLHTAAPWPPRDSIGADGAISQRRSNGRSSRVH